MMQVLLDECVPRPLRADLPEHAVRTAPEMGRQGKRNSELLDLAVSAGFDGFVTTDQYLQYQENLTGRNIAIIVIAAPSNRDDDTRPLMSKVSQTLHQYRAGLVMRAQTV